MKTANDKLSLVLKLTKAQNELLALHYKMDKTEYTEEQIARFTRLEEARDKAIADIEEALCTCEDYGFIGNHYCPIHVKTEG